MEFGDLLFIKKKGENDMSDFKKGLTIGILLMSSVFLLMAQTNSQIELDDRREIVDYKIVEYDYDRKKRDRTIDKSEFEGWEIYGNPFYVDGFDYHINQTFVKYKKD